MREGRIPRAIGLLLALAVVGMAVRFYAIRAREARWETQRVATLAILNQRTDDIQFEKAALTDVLDFIRDTYGVPLRVDWNALSQTGVGPQAPVSARLRQVRIDKLLRHILNETGSGNAPLAHDIADDGCIFITTERNLLSAVETRRYDIRDFLGLVPDDSTRLELMDAIRDLIMDSVATDSWKANGGEFADLRYENGFLVVTQTSPMHDRVCRLFEQLRETRANPLKILTAEYSTIWESR